MRNPSQPDPRQVVDEHEQRNGDGFKRHDQRRDYRGENKVTPFPFQEYEGKGSK